MTDRSPHGGTGRSPEDRRTDHEAIERLAAEVLPALVARLAASSLGEVEVREDDWRVRIRRPGTERRPGSGRGASGRGRDEGRHADGGRSGELRSAGGSVAAGGESGHGPGATAPGGSTDGGSLPPLTSVFIEPGPSDDHGPLVATSPAVGIFRLRGELRTGSRIRAGDRLASVDMLGVPQEVLAPADGIVATALVEDGDAVEYGQALIVLEPIAGKGA
jgi:biotin carboxyl carrier protein